MHYYPHNIGDFDKSTRHLNRIERSVYRDLLDVYYDTERPLTLDLNALCRKIVARSDEERTAVALVLNEFFTKTENGWHQDRCEEELERYRNNIGQKSEAGKKSAAARAAKKLQALNTSSTGVGTDVEHTNHGTSTNQEPITINHKPETINQKPDKKTYTDDFEQAWSIYPRRPGANKAEASKAWNARIKSGATPEQIIDGVTRYAAYVDAEGTEPQYIKHPATFFGPGEHYLSDWTPLKKGKKAEKFDPTAYMNGEHHEQCHANQANAYTIDVEAKQVDDAGY